MSDTASPSGIRTFLTYEAAHETLTSSSTAPAVPRLQCATISLTSSLLHCTRYQILQLEEQRPMPSYIGRLHYPGSATSLQSSLCPDQQVPGPLECRIQHPWFGHVHHECRPRTAHIQLVLDDIGHQTQLLHATHTVTEPLGNNRKPDIIPWPLHVCDTLERRP